MLLLNLSKFNNNKQMDNILDNRQKAGLKGIIKWLYDPTLLNILSEEKAISYFEDYNLNEIVPESFAGNSLNKIPIDVTRNIIYRFIEIWNDHSKNKNDIFQIANAIINNGIKHPQHYFFFNSLFQLFWFFGDFFSFDKLSTPYHYRFYRDSDKYFEIFLNDGNDKLRIEISSNLIKTLIPFYFIPDPKQLSPLIEAIQDEFLGKIFYNKQSNYNLTMNFFPYTDSLVFEFSDLQFKFGFF